MIRAVLSLFNLVASESPAWTAPDRCETEKQSAAGRYRRSSISSSPTRFRRYAPTSRSACGGAVQKENRKLRSSKLGAVFYSLFAERTRFELVIRVITYDGLANRWFQPLTHLSGTVFHRGYRYRSALKEYKDRTNILFHKMFFARSGALKERGGRKARRTFWPPLYLIDPAPLKAAGRNHFNPQPRSRSQAPLL